jgi:hypothetical protein
MVDNGQRNFHMVINLNVFGGRGSLVRIVVDDGGVVGLALDRGPASLPLRDGATAAAVGSRGGPRAGSFGFECRLNRLQRSETLQQLNRGRCYDHDFLRFLTIFGEKICVFFSKTNVMIKILHYLPLFSVNNANFFAKNCENI